MGHAEHFLSRLDRLASAEVELALQLYQDHELLRSVLAEVTLPEGAERVALALGDVAHGPYIVVTRDGHFVTCLAQGMSTGTLPVVSRGQLDALSNRFATLRERMALAARVAGTDDRERACSLVFRHIFSAADSVSREDFLAASAWQPLLGDAFLGIYLAMSAELLNQGYVLRNLRLPKSRRDEALHDYWNLLHATGHLALLGTMDGEGEHFQEVTAGQFGHRAGFAFALTWSTASKFIVQGAWATGRLGKTLLAGYKRALAEEGGIFEWLDTLFSLTAIARRSSGLRVEIAKALRSVPSTDPRSAQAARLREVMQDDLAKMAALAAKMVELDDSEWEPVLSDIGLAGLEEQKQNPRAIAALPADVLRALPLASRANGLIGSKPIATSLALVCASARGGPEQFYFPRSYAKQWRAKWEPELTERLLQPISQIERLARKPAVRVAKPGPNEPCSCGSAKKYKKCCGAPARA